MIHFVQNCSYVKKKALLITWYKKSLQNGLAVDYTQEIYTPDIKGTITQDVSMFRRLINTKCSPKTRHLQIILQNFVLL